MSRFRPGGPRPLFVLALWAAAVLLAAPLVAGLSTRLAPPSVGVPGSSSERAARILRVSFGIEAEAPGSDGRIPAFPGADIARALVLVVAFIAALVLVATRSLAAVGAVVGIELATIVVALGLVVVLPGLAPPHALAPGIAAAVGGGAALWLTLALASGKHVRVAAAGLAACGFLALLLPSIPALRAIGAAGVIGLSVAATAATTLAPLVPHRPSRTEPHHYDGPRPGFGAGIALALLAASALPLAGLRLDPGDLTATPPGLQIVIRDPRGLRDEGFAPLYALSKRLLRDPEVSEVRSIATLVEGATREQAQAFLQSPLGTDPSEPLLTPDAETTRVVVTTAHGPGSSQALDLVRRLQADLVHVDPPGGTAYIGGEAAAGADLERAASGALVPVVGAALWLTAAATWLWRRHWRAALAAAAIGGAAGVGALGLVTAAVQYGLGAGSLLVLAPPLVVAGGIGLGAAAALTTDDSGAVVMAAAFLAWTVLGPTGPRSLVLGLGASALLAIVAGRQRPTSLGRVRPASRSDPKDRIGDSAQVAMATYLVARYSSMPS